jgi:anti-sigma factor ChrR (cupin superfamily)
MELKLKYYIFTYCRGELNWKALLVMALFSPSMRQKVLSLPERAEASTARFVPTANQKLSTVISHFAVVLRIFCIFCRLWHASGG